MYIGHYKENIHCKDTFGNIPIEVIGVISMYIVADPYILYDKQEREKRKRNDEKNKERIEKRRK